jgi:hypothetical protein
MRRVGPVGFSVVAEAYRNFANWGAVLVLLLIGVLLGAMDRWPASVLPQAVTGVVLAALLNHIRNSWTPAPAQLAIGLALIGLVALVSRWGPPKLGSASRRGWRDRRTRWGASGPRRFQERADQTPRSRPAGQARP